MLCETSLTVPEIGVVSTRVKKSDVRDGLARETNTVEGVGAKGLCSQGTVVSPTARCSPLDALFTKIISN